MLSDHVQMNALASALKVNVNVAYLDGHDQQGQVSFVQFQNAAFTVVDAVTLLYRCACGLPSSPSLCTLGTRTVLRALRAGMGLGIGLKFAPYQARALRHSGPARRRSHGAASDVTRETRW